VAVHSYAPVQEPVQVPVPVQAAPEPVKFEADAAVEPAAASDFWSEFATRRTEPAVPRHEPAAARREPVAAEEPPVQQQQKPQAALKAPAEPQPTSLQRALGLIRTAMPIVQKLLPLLDRNVGTTVSNLITTFTQPPQPVAPPAPQAPPVDLTPIQASIVELKNQQIDLRDQVIEQTTAMKRVEDQLDMVREATDRNTLEQQELVEDLKSLGGKVNLIAAIAIGLLAISLLVNMALYMHLQKVLP
jgi:hypothetical protein